MDDPNMTMEEYVKLEEEKARRHGRGFNWQTATYGKIRVDGDFHDLRSVEAEFPAIIIDDTFAPQDALLCKSQVSTPVNNEIDFKISFDESDDGDYTIICDKNSFSYKMISINDMKTDSENDNEKADETSLSEYDKEEQNVLYFNDLFPFNIIRLDDSKSDEDNDDNDIDIVQSSGDNKVPTLYDSTGPNLLLFQGGNEQSHVSIPSLRALNLNLIRTSESEYSVEKSESDSHLNLNKWSRIIMEYMVKLSKSCAFWSLNEDILKIYDSDYQYVVSIKEDTTYPCLHSPKTMKEARSMRRI
ncbi:hypothetical protein Tco_0654668 [Tanacetum coccineum]|uniref:Uncharacterized protein n=1 Tax=Tanacetum coccineum TaxID=301880 RepID=A0ABQ4X3W0_9ASTR